VDCDPIELDDCPDGIVVVDVVVVVKTTMEHSEWPLTLLRDAPQGIGSMHCTDVWSLGEDSQSAIQTQLS
jgi:hypothetical protein